MKAHEAEHQILIEQLENTLKEIRGTIYEDMQAIDGWEMCATGQGKGPDRPPTKGWRKIGLPLHWGAPDPDCTCWFRTGFSIPRGLKGKAVALLLRPGGESLCYLNGKPTQGLCKNRDEVLLTSSAKGGERYDLLVEAVNTPYVNRLPIEVLFEYARLAVKRMDVHKFYWDARVALDAALVQPEGSMLRLTMVRLMHQVLKEVDLQHLGADVYFKSLKKAQKVLREGLKKFPSAPRDGKLFLTGHTHMDTAWLWPIRETRRKCGRTVASMLKYMEEYPEFPFSFSQPQLYAYIKEDYPHLHEQIRQRVREGRWECLGAPWVEQDNNVPSGESFVRQILYGNDFYDKEFGVRSRVAWLLDAFGFSGALPQIFKKAELDYFYTTKMTWNSYNPFPHSLFWWEGIDGTRILSIASDEKDNIQVQPDKLIGHWEKYRTKGLAPECLASFGFGDGGGGPTKEMLENGQRLKNLAGIPACRFGTIEEFFRDIEKSVPLQELPIWTGELYLELHRGCQTTHARTKRFNRKCELALRDAEILSARSYLSDGKYPTEDLRKDWEIVLLNQFHDILPGSSVTEVHKTSEKEFEGVLNRAHKTIAGAERQLLRLCDTRGEGQAVVVTNTLSWERSELVQIPLTKGCKHPVITGPDGRSRPVQRIKTEDGGSALLFLADQVPSMGHRVFHLNDAKAVKTANTGLKVSKSCMENQYLKIELNQAGEISRIYDKRYQRDVLEPGKQGNLLQLFEDRPHKHDAWDIDFNFEEKCQPFSARAELEVCEEGPLRARLRIRRKSEKSTLTQDVILYADSPRIDFSTTAEWNEKRMLLKAAFPLNIHAHKATYEIQFGTLERPTTRNHSWERAQFEVAAQRWADLSEGDYGVSLLNDCKYGYDCRGNLMRISLLRSPVMPDPTTDEGHHAFTYSLYPHAGDWRMGAAVRQSAELNTPLLCTPAGSHRGSLPPDYSWVTLDSDHIIVDSIKKAEADDSLILRLYEAHGCRGTAKIMFTERPSSLSECNLVERQDKKLKHARGIATLEFLPYEIKTVRVKF